MANTLYYFTGLRRFHAYSNTVNWKHHIGQKIFFKREHNNNYDKFAVAGKTLLKVRIDTPGMPYKKGQNFELPLIIRKLSHRL